MTISYVPAFEPPGLVLDDNFWDPTLAPDEEKGPPSLTLERQFLDSALNRTAISIEAISRSIELLRLRTTGDWKVVEVVQFEVPVHAAPSTSFNFIDLARLVFSTSEPLSTEDRADFNAANRPFARAVGAVPRKPRPI